MTGASREGSVAATCAAVGLALSYVSDQSDAPRRQLNVVEFDKLGVFIARMTQPRVPGTPERLSCAFDLAPGTHGHGLAIRTTRDAPMYLLDVFRAEAQAGHTYLEETGSGTRTKLRGLPNFSPKYALPIVEQLAGPLRRLTPDQIRAIGTHCSRLLLLRDIGYEIINLGRAILTGDSRVDPVHSAGECVRKYFENRKHYSGAYHAIRDNLAGRSREHFDACQDPADAIWAADDQVELREDIFVAIETVEAHATTSTARLTARAASFGYASERARLSQARTSRTPQEHLELVIARGKSLRQRSGR